MGSGPRNFGSDWIHIDGGDYPHLHSTNIVKLPLENESVDLIYSSHVIEYFNREEINAVLREWHRVLRPHAVLRVAVPDFETMAKLYVGGEYSLDSFLGPIFGQMIMGNKTIYHRTVYDFVSLKSILEKNGFEGVKRYNWRETDHSYYDDHSQAYLPHMAKNNGTLISLNVEAIKRKNNE